MLAPGWTWGQSPPVQHVGSRLAEAQPPTEATPHNAPHPPASQCIKPRGWTQCANTFWML